MRKSATATRGKKNNWDRSKQRILCRANARKKRGETEIIKKSGKRDVDARDPSGRMRASISVSSTFSFHSAPYF